MKEGSHKIIISSFLFLLLSSFLFLSFTENSHHDFPLSNEPNSLLMSSTKPQEKKVTHLLSESSSSKKERKNQKTEPTDLAQAQNKVQWWSLAFTNANDDTLNFVIENHGNSQEFFYELLSNNAQFYGDTLFIASGERQVVTLDTKALEGKKTGVRVTSGLNDQKEIYKN